MNVSGDIMVEYTYDAWGNVLSITGPMADTMGQHNQLRYRGYVYDPETELYFLNSRFYDPEKGRFINADDTVYLGADGTLLSYNLFAYCKNNPVTGYDPTGHFSWTDVFNVAAVVTIVALAVIAVVSSGGAAAPPLLAAASTIAGTTVTAAAATTVATGVVVTGVAPMGAAATASILEATSKNNANSKQGNEYKGKSIYNKQGERIDFEYNGNGTGNVHYDGTKGKEIIWRLVDGVEITYTVSKAVNKIISAPPFQKAISKAIDAVLSLAGHK